MKLKSSLIVALCVVVGVAACSKDKKNSAKLRQANKAAAESNLEKQKQQEAAKKQAEEDKKKGVTPTETGDGTAEQADSAVATDVKVTPVADAKVAATYSADEMTSADVKISGFKGEEAITSEIKMDQQAPVVNKSDCTMATYEGSTDKTLIIRLKTRTGEGEAQKGADLTLKFPIDLEKSTLTGVSTQVRRLKVIEASKEVISVTATAETTVALSYEITNIEAKKMNKDTTFKIKAGIDGQVNDATGKVVNVTGGFACAVDMSQAKVLKAQEVKVETKNEAIKIDESAASTTTDTAADVTNTSTAANDAVNSPDPQ